MPKLLILVVILTLLSACAQAASSLPNDCWFGVMALDEAEHGESVATGPVAQWRVGMSLVLYPTKENVDQLMALAEKGQTGTFDPSRPLTVTPTWISGPEPGDKGSGEEKEIQVTMKFSNAQGGHGTMLLTHWGPMSGSETSLPLDQQSAMARFDQQSHDVNCRGVP